MSNFLFFCYLTFSKKNNAKFILLIIFCVFIIILFFLYQTIILQTKSIYGITYFVYNYIRYVYLHIFLYEKIFYWVIILKIYQS